MNKTSNIFERTDCISEEMLTKYISGKLSPAEKHEVEKHLIDCEICSDAAEGLGMIPDKKQVTGITAELNQKIQVQISQISTNRNGKEVKIIFLRQYRTQLAVAASIILILGLVWFFRNNMMMKELDSASSEKIFADKFEPYPSEAKEETPPPVTSSEENRDANNTLEESNKQASAKKEGAKVALQMEMEKAQKGKSISDRETSGGTEDILVSEAAHTEMKALAEAISPDDYRRKNAENEMAGLKKDEDKKSTSPSIDGSRTTARTAIPVADKSGNPEEKKNRTENMARSETETKSQAEERDVLASEPMKKSKSLKKEKRAMSLKVSGGYYETTTKMNAGTNESLRSAAAVQDEVFPPFDSVEVETPAIKEAMQKYNKKDYTGAANDFEQALKQNPNDEKALFYSAVSYLSLGQTEKTITHLNKVMQNQNSEYYDASQWYLSLAYIKNNDLKNARENLLQIQNNSKSKYQKQADETLRETDK